MGSRESEARVRRVGVIGATSLVGECLLPCLRHGGWRVLALSRQEHGLADDGVEWRHLALFPSPLAGSAPLASLSPQGERGIGQWICVAPIWVLPEHFTMLEAYGARRVVALSSTSRFTKDDSSDPEEQAIALRLADAESRVQVWAASHGVEWVILRPTLIYGLGRDKNIAEIARFVRRFGFFPLFGKAKGLRQPLHAQDVAGACIAALGSPDAANHAYNLSGFDAIAYRDMVARIFSALGRPVRLLPVPLFAFRFAVALLRILPRYRSWSSAMAERMNRDLVFDHSEATRDFGFKPRPFVLSAEDVSA